MGDLTLIGPPRGKQFLEKVSKVFRVEDCNLGCGYSNLEGLFRINGG